MKRILPLLFVLSFFGPALCQERSFDVAVSAGFYSTPGFDKAQTGRNYSAEFDYHLKKGWIISSAFNFGKFRYFESGLSNAPDATVYQDGTNAEVSDRQVSVKVKKDLFRGGDFNVRVGTGLAILTETKTYPYRFLNSGAGYGYGYIQSTFSDLAFPVSVEPYYRVYSRFYLGLKAEMYIEPDFPLMGFSFGPQIRVRL